MQFGFMPGRGTTDAIFILRQLQEKHLAKNKKLYFAFVDLEKAFECVPRKVIWWAMRKLGIEEWIVWFVQAMYNNTRSRVWVNNTYSDEFGVKVGVHQGSVLSPLLFVIVLEALSREFRTGTPWELLYADDLVISAETEEGLKIGVGGMMGGGGVFRFFIGVFFLKDFDITIENQERKNRGFFAFLTVRTAKNGKLGFLSENSMKNQNFQEYMTLNIKISNRVTVFLCKSILHCIKWSFKINFGLICLSGPKNLTKMAKN